MKNRSFFTILCAALLSAKGYAHSHHTTYVIEEHHPHHHADFVFVEPAPSVFVNIAPPCDVDEDIAASPGEGFVWVKGYWAWDGSRYVRVHGHYVARPHAYAVWVPGHWSEHHGKWRWHEGYWSN